MGISQQDQHSLQMFKNSLCMKYLISILNDVHCTSSTKISNLYAYIAVSVI